MAGESILQTLQRAATIMHRLDEVTEDVAGLRAMVTDRMDRHDGEIGSLRERVARLDVARDADHARFEADLARFTLEVERAELRLTRRLPGSRKEPRGE